MGERTDEPYSKGRSWLRLGLLLASVGLTGLLVLLSAEQSAVNQRQEDRLRAIAARLQSLALARRKREERRLPQALIIGARKGGTRALLEFLNLHPQIRTARTELHFFDNNQTYAKGLDWYRQQMPRAAAGDVVLEKTPAYFTSAAVPARVAAFNPDVKLILIVRDPVERTISDYTQVHYTKLSKAKPHEPLEQLAFDARNGQLNLDYKPVRNSLYVKHLRRWLRHFPLSQLHIVDGDAFAVSPLGELRALEAFLGLPPLIREEQLLFNATKGFYCFYPPRGDGPRCLGDSKGRPHVSVSAETRQRLAAGLAPFSRRFQALAQRPFPAWTRPEDVQTERRRAGV